MANTKIYDMPFSELYRLYVAKAEKKNRSKDEVNNLIYWLTGYNKESLEMILKNDISVRMFFNHALNFNPKANLITGNICGVKIEEITDPLMKRIRYLDKLIDELAKGKPLSKILR
jgi:hypothetical protein